MNKDSYEILISKLVFGGDGLGRLPDGRAVFIPFVLPGEVVEARLVEDKSRFARAVPVNIINPSPDRITPVCPHFGSCGGCHYQHVPYEKQLELKLDVLKDQLQRIGGIPNPPVTGISASDASLNYRNHVQFHLCDNGSLGYKDFLGSRTFPISECHLPQAGINQIWQQIEMDPDTEIQRISLRQDSYDDIMLLLEGKDEFAPEFKLDLPISACYLAPDGRTTNLAGDDSLLYEINNQQLRVSPESFFQVNTPQAEKMIVFVLEHLPKQQNPKILELYSGVGLFSMFLAPLASQLVAIENAPSSGFDFAINLDSYDNVSLYEADVEDVLPGLNFKPDLVLLDPPRVGLAKNARDALLKLAPTSIIYISCDPATLSRDLKSFLSAGYQLSTIKAFDMFPQTYHVESITVLTK